MIKLNDIEIVESDFIDEDNCSKKITEEILTKYNINRNEFIRIVKDLAHKNFRAMRDL